ncbi:D-alanyl-D-alanine carboxypeptidase/D-alanyl-D-alanine-endopeptidase [Robertkochia flava]|uniref:D-alanyl-D-alanine carboxypeptidase/D-alanyl-D-alanine-endopeptidase n=1 Tax=Robertkochia flava TaxID=3447986 RepID=UPI001CC91A76|nr:D-alanyl-D-alanine carboxypeptidase [Robertkochia marina]
MRYFLACCSVFLLISCGSNPKRQFSKALPELLNDPYFENQFTGIFIIDPESRDTLYQQNSGKYFTPASNTKIFTLFTAMELLPELLPQLQYQAHGDTIYIRGTGDPTLLHPYFKSGKSLELIAQFPHIKYLYNRFQDTPLGPGWSWADFDAYYSAERSGLPLYGNVVLGGKTPGGEPWMTPDVFPFEWSVEKPRFNRKRDENHFYLYTNSTADTLEIPFVTDTSSVRTLLENLVKKPVELCTSAPGDTWETIYGVPADSVYKRMMKISDNFIAEQLLIQASGIISDTLDPSEAIEFMFNGPLSDMAQQPRWVDGSGLSRYNLFTPESMVHVLDKLYQCYGTERLYAFFPEGGVSGTIKNYFHGNDKPYLHAKTGTLSNNYCLSGYLETQSGKTLIFSFMNNHYMGSSTPLKAKMTPVLEWIRDHY